MINNFRRFIRVLGSWVGKILLLIVIIPLILGFLANRQAANAVPDAVKAPWVVKTYLYLTKDGETYKTLSHVYYGASYETINTVPSIQGYWEWNGKKYVYYKGIKSFPVDIWGSVDIIRRTK